MQLRHKSILITGAGSGIGRATALLAAREGARVTAADIDPESAKNTARVIVDAGGEADAQQVDVARGDEVQAMVEGAHRHWGRLDILVNNAGFGFRATVEETREEDWDRIMSVNMKGVFLGCKHAIPLMRAQGGGVIVNTASVASNVGIPERAAYCATKGGVAALTRAMAVDHAKDNIRVNAVGPGRVDSPYFEAMLRESDDPDAMREQLIEGHLLGRMATPEEIARAIVFLAGDQSSYMTGSLMLVDGGFTAH